jgi:sialic acid synthase SpsE
MTGKLEIIAEIGVNHGGSLRVAKELIRAAKDSGASSVKFQSFSADRLVTPDLGKVEYQLRSNKDKTETQHQMLRKLEIGPEGFRELYQFSNSLGLQCFTTPYSREDLEELTPIGLKTVKIASADIVDLELVKAAADSGARVLLSTGMADLEEIDKAVEIFWRQNSDFVLFHSTSAYPAPADELNLAAITEIKNRYACEVGYSDHSLGNTAAVLAAALGTRIFERHFTLDKGKNGPDHMASSDPEEFSDYVDSLRIATDMLGDGEKKCMPSELEMRSKARKKIIAAREIQINETVKRDMVSLSRADGGLEANELARIIGYPATKSYLPGDLVTLDPHV